MLETFDTLIKDYPTAGLNLYMTPPVLRYDRRGHTPVFTVSSRKIISRMDSSENGLAVRLWDPLSPPRSTNNPSTAGSITVYRKTTGSRGLVWCKKGLVRSRTEFSSLAVVQDDHIPFHAALIWTHSATPRPRGAISLSIYHTDSMIQCSKMYVVKGNSNIT